MLGKNTLDIAAIIVAIGASLAINRSNIKKETIKDLRELVEAQKLKIESLEEELEELRAIVAGNPELVREGIVAGRNGPRGRDSAAYSQAAKNRSSG
ncbi:MAG TPA: hypothetical protein VIY48_13085 [Candidatus Paceibacterota bacterium]